MKETKKFNLRNYDEFDELIKEKEMFGWEYISQNEMITYGSVEHYKGGLIQTSFNVNSSENYRLEARGQAYLEVTMQREKSTEWYEEVCKYESEYRMLDNWFYKDKRDAARQTICNYYSIPYEFPKKPVFNKEKPVKFNEKFIFFMLFGPLAIIFILYCLYKLFTIPHYKKLAKEYNEAEQDYNIELRKYKNAINEFDRKVATKVDERRSFIKNRTQEIVK